MKIKLKRIEIIFDMKKININKGSYCFRRIYFFVLSIFLYPYFVSAQNFERAYGSIYEDIAQHLVPAFDGGYLITGYTLNSTDAPGNSYDILLVKTDSVGNAFWSKTIGSTKDEISFWIEPTKDGTYLICGSIFDNNAGEYDDFLININGSGSILSQKIYTVNHEERAFCVRETNDGGFVVSGETVLGGVDLQMNLFKIDTAGNVLWSKSYGDNAEQESASYVKQTNDNGYIMCGASRCGLIWSSIFIVKTDSSGNLQWSKKYNTQPYLSRCEVSRIVETSDGGYIVSGVTSANQPLKSILLMKISSTGSVVWQSIYGTGGGERNNDIIKDANGYVVCGSTATTSGYNDLLLMKTDTVGNLLWNLAYGVQDSNTIAYSMVKSNDGKFMIAGSTDAYGAGDIDFLLVKSDSIFGSENSLCNTILPGIIQDTITLVATPYYISASVNTLSLNGNFSAVNGIHETPICIMPSGLSSHESPFQIEITPNPFKENVTIITSTLESTTASVIIYDTFGREIKTMYDNFSSRLHRFCFSMNECSIHLSSGIYYCIISSGNYKTYRKIIFAD